MYVESLTVTNLTLDKAAPIHKPVDMAPQPEYKSNKCNSVFSPVHKPEAFSLVASLTTFLSESITLDSLEDEPLLQSTSPIVTKHRLINQQ